MSHDDPQTVPTGVPQTARRRPRWRTVFVPAALLVAVATTAVAVGVRLRADAACDVGVNAGAAGLGHLGAATGLLLVAVVTALVASRTASPLVAVPLLVLMLGAASWFFLSATWPPVGYPDAVAGCSDNVPGWWPGWLPRRGG